MANMKLTPKMTESLNALANLGGKATLRALNAKNVKYDARSETGLYKRGLIVLINLPGTYSPEWVQLTDAGRKVVGMKTEAPKTEAPKPQNAKFSSLSSLLR